MSRFGVVLCVLCGLAGPPVAVADEEPEEPQEESAEEALRERITEREDKRRPREPFTIGVFQHPLTLGGEYEIANERLRRRGAARDDRSRLEQQLELEAFYTVGKRLSVFAQAQLRHDRELLSSAGAPGSDSYVTRGEMWLFTEQIFGSHFNFDVGRLDHEDERRWWWDQQLDSLRLTYEIGSFELALSLARELAPERSNRDEVEAAQEDVQRVIGELSWDFSSGHVAQVLFLSQNDRSSTEAIGQEVALGREDESDARLTWLGVRLMGAFRLPRHVLAGYWLDAAHVRGDERRVEFDSAATPGFSQAVDATAQRVSGQALDVGLSAVLPLPLEPRLFAGYAHGSGDPTANDGRDQSFRQTGLQANESGFGGVERFESYGIALDPDLSNLRITTLGAGLTVLKSSSLDLVYHGYRLDEPAGELRDSRLATALTGASRALGQGVDAMLAVEEWERFEFALALSGFRAGGAFAAGAGRWSYAGFLAVRYSF